MTLVDALTQVTIAVLREQPALAGIAVFDAPPVRAAPPFVEVLPPVVADWGTKDRRGAEIRMMIRVEDAGERPIRLAGIVEGIERAVAALPAISGWDAGSIVRTRARSQRRGSAAKDERWTATVEFRLRLLANEGDE